MKLKATNPLVLFVGALAIGLAGCADDAIITEPPPPPPPPPPESAEISIQSITDADTNTEIGTSEDDPIGGTIGVIINFDTGGFEAAALDVFVDSDQVPCQTFSGQAAVGLAADVQRVQCLIDTREGVGSCAGETLLGRFDNGAHIISAELTLGDGSSVRATRSQPLLFSNADAIIVVPNDIGPRVVGLDAEAWWGGPRDLTWYACPIIFSSSLDDVCEITVVASDATMGGASGTTSSETSEEPFGYTAAYRDSDGLSLNEDSLEQEDHTLTPTTVLACDGLDISSSFDKIADTRNLDGTAPMCDTENGDVGDGECEPVIDGADMWVLTNGLYSDGGIMLDDAVDSGVGIGEIQLDAYDWDDGDPDNQALFTADIGDVADLPEDDGCGTGETTDITTQQGCGGVEAGVPVDAYFVFIESVKDLLENALGDSPDELDLAILDVFDNSEEFGTDFTSPETDEFEPANEAAGPVTSVFVWNPDLGLVTPFDPADRDCPSDDSTLCESIMWEAVDPDLASEDDPSGVENGSCARAPAPRAPTTTITTTCLWTAT